ncbi:MAG: hypothetical protein ACP5H3_02960 [Candidatus Aenigmatarchaeota archaeon]
MSKKKAFKTRTYNLSEEAANILKSVSENVGFSEGKIVSNVITTLYQLNLLEIVSMPYLDASIAKRLMRDRLCEVEEEKNVVEKREEKKEEKKEEKMEEREERKEEKVEDVEVVNKGNFKLEF